MNSWLRSLAIVGVLSAGVLLIDCTTRTSDRDTTSSRNDQSTPGYGGAGTQGDSKSPAGYQTPSDYNRAPPGSTSDQTTPSGSSRTPDSMGSPGSTPDTSSNPDTSTAPGSKTDPSKQR